MTDPQPRKRLLVSRGFVPVGDFRHATGLTESDLSAGLAAGVLHGAFDESGRLLGVWDDVLPAPAQLRHIGLDVTSTYTPEALRTTSPGPDGDDLGADEDDDVADDDSAPAWSISW